MKDDTKYWLFTLVFTALTVTYAYVTTELNTVDEPTEEEMVVGFDTTDIMYPDTGWCPIDTVLLDSE